MKILGTGLTGLVGSRIVELLKDYEFENLSSSFGVDITNRDQVFEKIISSKAPILLHLAGKTNVDECEKDKDKDTKILGYKDIEKQEEEFNKAKTAWGVNVVGTKNVVDACEKSKKKIIFFSTDFVFNGEKPIGDGYSEEEQANPINWYGKTKLEAEKIVQTSDDWLIIRIAYPYRANFKKKDFVRSILEKLKNYKQVKAVNNQIFTPTFIDDIASCLDLLISNNAQGIFHAVGAESLTPFDTSISIADTFSLDKSLIEKINREVYFQNRAERPFNLSIKNDKIKKFGVKMKGFREGIEEVKRQMK